MANKSNIRSIRFSDELAELIDQQIGDTFTAKFENLVTRCVWELPAKEKEIQRLDAVIADKQREIALLSNKSTKIANTLKDLETKIFALDAAIFFHTKEWYIE